MQALIHSSTKSALSDKTSSEHLQELLQLDRLQLKMIFAFLPPANIGSTIGEFNARLLDQGDPISGVITRTVFRAQGPWLGKAFRPTRDGCGEGYNIFGAVERPKRKLRMDSYIGDSAVALGQSMILDYRKLNRGPICWLTGELRKLGDGVLLGMGIFRPPGTRTGKYKRIIPFVLSGPNAEYCLQNDANTTDRKHPQ